MDNRLNIILFMTPKDDLTYIYEDSTLGDILAKMENSRFSAIPVLKSSGEYAGTLTEGDILWAIKNQGRADFKYSKKIPVSDVPRHSDHLSVKISADIEELFTKSLEQNFVPVEDDRGMFIGIVTRRNIIRFYQESLKRETPDTGQKGK